MEDEAKSLRERHPAAKADIDRRLTIEREKGERSRKKNEGLAMLRSRSRSHFGGRVSRKACGAGGAGRMEGWLVVLDSRKVTFGQFQN